MRYERPLRSMLFVPADNSRMVEKALTVVPADAVILDLEDALALNRKDAGRAVVRESAARGSGTALFVRVNHALSSLLTDDLDCVVRDGVTGVILPKVQDATHLAGVHEQMLALETSRGLPSNSIALVPIIETAAGLVNVVSICGSGIPRVPCVAFGAGDFTIDVGFEWSRGEEELNAVRAAIAVASRTARLDAPVDTVFTDLGDDEGYEASCWRGRRYGFQGKAVIHPAQVQEANRIYGVSEEEVRWSGRVVQAFADREADGVASMRLNDKLIDYAHLRLAQGLLERHERESGTAASLDARRTMAGRSDDE